MRKMRTFLSLLLTLCVVLAVSAVPALAADAVVGDANGDGAVNNVDAMLILQHSVGLKQLDEQAMAACDVNGDGSVNNVDAMQVLQRSVGLLTKFPVEEPEGDEDGEHQHSYECEIIIPPHCLFDGEATYTCACGDSYTEALPKTEHDWTEWRVYVEPTTESIGWKDRSCKICHGGQQKSIDMLSADIDPDHVHDYTAEVEAPACESGGYTTYTCSCGHAYTGDETAATGHTFEIETIPPTTDAEGYDLHTCTMCGMEYVDNFTDRLPDEDMGEIINSDN